MRSGSGEGRVSVQSVAEQGAGEGRREMSWKLIKTAPKDGTRILGYFPRNKGFVARLDVQPIVWTGWGGGCWETLGGGRPLDNEITHWMPLPEPPGGCSMSNDTVPDRDERCECKERINIPDGWYCGKPSCPRLQDTESRLTKALRNIFGSEQ